MQTITNDGRAIVPRRMQWIRQQYQPERHSRKSRTTEAPAVNNKGIQLQRWNLPNVLKITNCWHSKQPKFSIHLVNHGDFSIINGLSNLAVIRLAKMGSIGTRAAVIR